MSHKRKIRECIEEFQQKLKKIKDELPVYEPDREQINTIFESIDNYCDFSDKPRYSIYSGHCTQTVDGVKESRYFSLQFEFEDEETFQSIEKEYNHPVIIKLFNKYVEVNEESILTTNEFDDIEHIDAEEAEDWPIVVSRKRVEKYNAKKKN